MKQQSFFVQLLVVFCLLFGSMDAFAQISKYNRNNTKPLNTIINKCDCTKSFTTLSESCKEFCSKIEVQEIIIHDNISVGTGDPHGNEDPFFMRVGPGKIPFFGIGKKGGIRLGTALFPEQGGEINLGSNKRPFRQVFALKFAEISDRREKENIVTLPYGLKDVMELQPVAFTWKKNAIEGRHVGLIAQEVEEVIPEIVTRQNFMNPKTGKATDRLSVAYSELVPVLIHAIQEQQTIIEAQKQQLGQQTDAISSLETTVSQLIEALQTQGIQTQKAKTETSDAK